MKQQVWSCGGGVQSTAIAALIVQGKLPKPDFAAIVDTGRENSSTWNYLNAVTKPALASVGVDLRIISKQQYATVDLYSIGSSTLLLPAFTTLNDEGKLTNWCSHEWKRRVLMRWLREQGVKECENWIGISCDELQRVRLSRERWLQHRYPLIELRMRRGDCVAAVEAMGWPAAPRSSCWMCPNKSDAEWRDLKENHPADFAAAIAIEKELQAVDPDIFLHSDCKPLAEVDFTDQQMSLFGDNSCSSGYCFI